MTLQTNTPADMTGTLFLSQLVLDSAHRAVQRDLVSTYEMHRTIMRGYPEDTPREKANVLFRVEPVQGQLVTVLVQSSVAPDWRWLKAQPWSRQVASKALPLDHFDIPLGTELAFRLRANPTVCRDGKRHGLFKDKQQLAWLARKGEDSGFKVTRALTIKEGDQVVRQTKKGPITLFAVRFEGLLRVLNAERIREGLTRGIGRGKSFGFGLLSLGHP